MSGIVLSSSVRQNLLSLQSTADLLATTQNRLATGKKVNSALDNPTNFFTAPSLDSRASDINNLLDGIGNGVQVLQAANTGITSLQKLVDSAKSIANQALQTTVGYVKSSATGAVSGATAGNLLGTTAQVTSSVNGSVLVNNASQTYTANPGPAGAVRNNNHLGAYQAPVHAGSAIPGAASTGTLLSGLTTPPTVGDTLTVGASTFTITAATSERNRNRAHRRHRLRPDQARLGGRRQRRARWRCDPDHRQHQRLPRHQRNGNGCCRFGPHHRYLRPHHAATTDAAITASTMLAGAATPSSDALSSAMTVSDAIKVNNTTIRFFDTGNSVPAPTTPAFGDVWLDLASADVGDLKSAIDTASGGTSTLSAGSFTLTTGTGANIVLSDVSGTGLAKLGLTAGTIARTSAPAVAAPISGTTALKGAVGTNSLTSNFTTSDTITVNGKNLAFYDASTGGTAGIAADTTYFDISTATVADVLARIDVDSGGTGSNVNGGKVTLNAGTTAALAIGGSGLAKLGLVAGTTAASTP